jgi:hypothetical protein
MALSSLTSIVLAIMSGVISPAPPLALVLVETVRIEALGGKVFDSAKESVDFFVKLVFFGSFLGFALAPVFRLVVGAGFERRLEPAEDFGFDSAVDAP